MVVLRGKSIKKDRNSKKNTHKSLRNDKAKLNDEKPEKHYEFDEYYGKIDISSGRPVDAQLELMKKIKKSKKTKCLDLSQNSTNKVYRYSHKCLPHELNLLKIKNENKNNLDSEVIALDELWLTNNQVDLMTTTIYLKNLQNLQILGLGNNDLRVLPSEIGLSLINLKKLYLEKNKLNSLPDTLINLKHLSELLLDENKFKNFPLVITTFRHLKRLGLSYNAIKTIPSQIRKLTNLIELNLDYNQIGPTLPNEILHLKCLRNIGLECNCLKSKPDFLFEIKSLYICRVAGNREPGYDVLDLKSGKKLNNVNTPKRFDGYLQLVKEPDFQQKNIVPIEGHMECSRNYNIRNGLWLRNKDGYARTILRARSLKKKWKTSNRLID